MLYKSELLTLETIGYSWDLLGWVLVYRCKWPFILMYISWMLIGTCLYFGRAPRTKETLPDFLEKCRVTRHSGVFPRVDG